jgi:hypothetical protein
MSEFGNQYDNTEGNTNLFTVKEFGANIIRFVLGKKEVNKVWLPVVYNNQDDLAKERWKVFTVKGDSIFRRFQAAHELQLANSGVKNPRTTFKAQQMFAYLVLVRADEELQLRVGEFKWSVMNQLEKLGSNLDPNDSSKYVHGPFWFWDANVIKSKDAKTGFPNYSVEPYANKFSCRTPKKVKLDTINYVEKGIFTQAELMEFDRFKKENGITQLSEFLNTYEEPQTNAEILDFFSLDGKLDFDRRRDGMRLFEDPKGLIPILEEAGVTFLLQGSNVHASAELPAHKEGVSEATTDDKWIEDAEWSEVDDSKSVSNDDFQMTENDTTAVKPNPAPKVEPKPKPVVETEDDVW